MAGMFGTCEKCGGAYPLGANFCSRCGEPLSRSSEELPNAPSRDKETRVSKASAGPQRGGQRGSTGRTETTNSTAGDTTSDWEHPYLLNFFCSLSIALLAGGVVRLGGLHTGQAAIVAFVAFSLPASIRCRSLVRFAIAEGVIVLAGWLLFNPEGGPLGHFLNGTGTYSASIWGVERATWASIIGAVLLFSGYLYYRSRHPVDRESRKISNAGGHTPGGILTCPYCGSTQFKAKRAAKAKVGGAVAGGLIGALLMPKTRSQCVACGKEFLRG